MKTYYDDFVKETFCKLLGADQWTYPHEPSYYFNEWRSYLHGEFREYEWDKCRYELAKESKKSMVKLIFDIYLKESWFENLDTI